MVSDNCKHGADSSGYGKCFNKLECADTPQGTTHVCDHDRNCHFACQQKPEPPTTYTGKRRIK